ncbi:MAG: RDD family protein [Mucilaginibacter polytrichastri]|nr:RDD family protein [Mucilaginibacter polytrichastri]
MIDYSIVIFITYHYISFFGEKGDDDTSNVYGVMMLPPFALWFVYFVVAEGVDGGTLMHQLFKLKVLSEQRTKIGMTAAFKRHLLDRIDFFIYGLPAVIAIKFSAKHQRLGDMFARTIVVDKTDAQQYKTENPSGLNRT